MALDPVPAQVLVPAGFESWGSTVTVSQASTQSQILLSAFNSFSSSMYQVRPWSSQREVPKALKATWQVYHRKDHTPLATNFYFCFLL